MKTIAKIVAYLWFAALMTGCTPASIEEEIIPEPAVELKIDPEIAIKWSTLSLEVIKGSRDNSPTYASRSLAYLGIGMYEAAVPGSIIYQSIAGELNGMPELPKTIDSLTYDWELSINTAEASILKFLYPHAPDKLKSKIDSLEMAEISLKRELMISEDVIIRSINFGNAVAEVIQNWSLSDGGHEGYNSTFTRNYVLPNGLAYWIPPFGGQSAIRLPMHAYWGENRTFIAENAQLDIPAIIPFSQEPDSPYFQEMQTVYLVQNNLEQSQKENAIWWGDDPGDTVSPPGHSYYLATKLVAEKNINLFEASSVLAKVGISVADAFINCWKCKYHFHAERPTNYIRRTIDPVFRQFWPEPPFPAFTSGHSTQAAATAISLISVFGDNTPFTDDLHEGRAKDILRDVEFKSRNFDTIWEMAEECGYSRIEGGIHTPQDNSVGLAEGRKIGDNVVALKWKVESVQQ